jgi:hypothetical protein
MAAESPATVPATPEKLGVLWVVVEPATGLIKVTSGTVVSATNDSLAGVASVSPAVLIARTWKV